MCDTLRNFPRHPSCAACILLLNIRKSKQKQLPFLSKNEQNHIKEIYQSFERLFLIYFGKVFRIFDIFMIKNTQKKKKKVRKKESTCSYV